MKEHDASTTTLIEIITSGDEVDNIIFIRTEVMYLIIDNYLGNTDRETVGKALPFENII